MDYMSKTALELGRAIKNKTVGCVELTKAVLENVKRMEPEIHAYITVAEEQALARAEEIQIEVNEGVETAPIAGVPMAFTDDICTTDMLTTCASKMLDGFRPPYDATAAAKLRQAGAVIIGKLNMDEFGMGESCFGPAKNPWDTACTPGRSAAGAAVAAGGAIYALGGDTGGTIRGSAAYTGTSAIKPTYGTVSRYGLVAYASSMDQIGPVGRTVGDCAAVLAAVYGYDEKDSTSAQISLDFTDCFDGKASGLKIGLPKGYLKGLDKDVCEAVTEAAKLLEKLGAVIEEFDLPLTEYAIPAYHILSCAEASSNLSRFDGIKYGYRGESPQSLEDEYLLSRSGGFGIEVKKRIMAGSLVLSSGHYESAYKKAMRARGMISRAFDNAFGRYDIVLCPTMPDTACKIGESRPDDGIFTVPASLAGVPAVTLPCGFTDKGMPVGLQLMGKAFSEPVLVRAAHALQINTDFHTKRPDICGGGAGQ